MDKFDHLRTVLVSQYELIVILAVGGGLMGYGIWAVQPVVMLPDEAGAVQRALKLGLERTVFIDGFRKGGNLHVHLLMTGFAFYYVYLVLTGTLDDVVAAAGEVTRTGVDPWAGPELFVSTLYDFVIIGRLLSVLAGIATIFVVYLLGKRLYDRRAGLLAAAFLSVSLVFVNTAHFATEDVPMTFFITVTMLFVVRHISANNRRDLYLASFASGLAVSTKATAGILVFPMAMALLNDYFVRFRGERDSLPELFKTGTRYLTYPVVALLGYLLTTPSILLYPGTWWGDIVSEIDNQSRAYATDQIGWLVQGANVADGLGLLLFLLSLLGVGFGLFRLRHSPRRTQPELYLLLFFVPYFAVTGSWVPPQIWHTLPMLPILMVLNGGLCRFGLSKFERTRAVEVAIIAILLFSFWYSAAGVTEFTNDSRIVATTWNEDHLESGSVVDVHATRHYLPGFTTDVEVVRTPIYAFTPEENRQIAIRRVECGTPDYLVMSSFQYGRYFRNPTAQPAVTSFYRTLFDGGYDYEIVKRFGQPFDRDLTTSDRLRSSLEPNGFKVNPRIVVFSRIPGASQQC